LKLATSFNPNGNDKDQVKIIPTLSSSTTLSKSGSISFTFSGIYNPVSLSPMTTVEIYLRD
jgi:hypothetical protein